MDEEQNQRFSWKKITGTQASAENWLFPGRESKMSGVSLHERYLLRNIDIGFSVLGIILSSTYIGVSYYYVPTAHFIALTLVSVWSAKLP